MTITEQLDKAYHLYSQQNDSNNKYDFLEEIFGIITYDSGDGSAQEYLINKILDVINCINESENYKYIEKSEQNYFDYITVCNLDFVKSKIEWGSSIRGAWFVFGFNLYEYVDYDYEQIYVEDNKDLNKFIEWANS